MYTMHLLGCYLFSYLRKSGALCVSEHAGTLVRIIIRIMLVCLHCEMEVIVDAQEAAELNLQFTYQLLLVVTHLSVKE